MRGLGDGHDAPFSRAVDRFGGGLNQGGDGERDGKEPFGLDVGFTQACQGNSSAVGWRESIQSRSDLDGTRRGHDATDTDQRCADERIGAVGPDEGQGGGQIRFQRHGGRAFAPMGTVTLFVLLVIAAGEGAEACLCGAGRRSSTRLPCDQVGNRAFWKMIVEVRRDASLELATPSIMTVR